MACLNPASAGATFVNIRAQQPVSARAEVECSAAFVVLLPLCKYVLRLLLLLLHLSKFALPAFDATVDWAATASFLDGNWAEAEHRQPTSDSQSKRCCPLPFVC